MKKCFSIIFVCLILSSCYSFNHITLPPDTKPTDVRLVKAITGEVAAPIVETPKAEPKKTPSEITCPVYTLPDVAPMPELPYKELAKARDNDTIDAIQTKHIEELRQYVMDVRKQLKKSHDDYLTKCSK
jgi:hypothetical protein